MKVFFLTLTFLLLSACASHQDLSPTATQVVSTSASKSQDTPHFNVLKELTSGDLYRKRMTLDGEPGLGAVKASMISMELYPTRENGYRFPQRESACQIHHLDFLLPDGRRYFDVASVIECKALPELGQAWQDSILRLKDRWQKGKPAHQVFLHDAIATLREKH